MITFVVDGQLESPADRVLRDQIYRLRHRVFRDRLRWNVNEEAGRERDRFDELAQAFAVTLDRYDRVVGTWRLVPSTGPYMLRDVFPTLLHGQEPPCDPAVWEVSRFAVATPDGSTKLEEGVMRELVAALFRFGHERGLRQIVGVTDILFERLLYRCGLATQRFGPPLTIGSTRAVAGWAEVEPAYRALNEGRAGSDQDVVERAVA